MAFAVCASCCCFASAASAAEARAVSWAVADWTTATSPAPGDEDPRLVSSGREVFLHSGLRAENAAPGIHRYEDLIAYGTARLEHAGATRSLLQLGRSRNCEALELWNSID